MTLTDIPKLLLFIAAIIELLAALNVPSPINLIALGLVFFLISLIIV